MQALPLSPGTGTETVWPITLEHGPERNSISGYSRMCVRKKGCEQPPMIRWKRRSPYPKRESEYLFLLNHSGKKQELAVSVNGKDLLSGREICRGEVFAIDAAGVILVKVLERV